MTNKMEQLTEIFEFNCHRCCQNRGGKCCVDSGASQGTIDRVEATHDRDGDAS